MANAICKLKRTCKGKLLIVWNSTEKKSLTCPGDVKCYGHRLVLSESAWKSRVRKTRLYARLLEEVGLVHDAKKLFLVYLTIAVTIRLIYHLLQLLICHSFAK